jgi:hypothetical protein
MGHLKQDDDQAQALSRRHRGHGEGTIVERRSEDGATRYRA